jgi:hypothetical protein
MTSRPFDNTEPLPPWGAKLSPKSRAAADELVADWPPLTDRQRERLRLLFRPKGRDAT